MIFEDSVFSSGFSEMFKVLMQFPCLDKVHSVVTQLSEYAEIHTLRVVPLYLHMSTVY